MCISLNWDWWDELDWWERDVSPSPLEVVVVRSIGMRFKGINISS